jgi:hypothetical protein
MKVENKPESLDKPFFCRQVAKIRPKRKKTLLVMSLLEFYEISVINKQFLFLNLARRDLNFYLNFLNF